jgi:hypothetical protein
LLTQLYRNTIGDFLQDNGYSGIATSHRTRARSDLDDQAVVIS